MLAAKDFKMRTFNPQHNASTANPGYVIFNKNVVQHLDAIKIKSCPTSLSSFINMKETLQPWKSLY